MSFKVAGGSFGSGFGSLSANTFHLPKKSGWGSQKINIAQVVAVESASEERVKKLGGTLGWGATGALVLGPVGLLAGLMLGGKKTEVAFIVSFADGRSFLGVSNHSEWVVIKAATLEAISANHRKAIRDSSKGESPSTGVTSETPPPPPSDVLKYAEWAFLAGGWDLHRKPKAGYERYTILHANRGPRSVIAVASQDAVTDHSLSLMIRSLADCEGAERIVVAPRFSKQTERAAQTASITLCEPSDLKLGIVQL